MKQTSLLIILAAMLFTSCTSIGKKTSYSVPGVGEPVIKLNGTWKVNTHPVGEFWNQPAEGDNWKDILVPGELMMQGIAIKHNMPFAYKRAIEIPGDYSEKRILLRFEGVYSYARVWVNGEYVRDHSGGFTQWDCDITGMVTPGDTAVLTIEVTDKADEISYGSGYAKHQIGGILRDVTLLALPENYLQDISIRTDFDEEYRDAVLTVSGKAKLVSDKETITVELYDPQNRRVRLDDNSHRLESSAEFELSFPVSEPVKWDAEHPNLYTLVISHTEVGNEKWRKSYPIGFREIEIKGNRMLVNGREVKLRGACRHDIHPLLGRVSTPEYELMDVLLAKEANFNFIRTSHYPPTENFLRLCDSIGIYVEDETAVCFVGSHRTAIYYPGSSESDPAYTDRYMDQLKEMVTNHRNHPSVVIWSIGNENSFGSNFKKSYDWVKETDPTRPVIFSYPGHVPDSVKAYDILSMHYPDLTGTMNQIGKQTNNFGYGKMPVIFDEWAHVACYNNQTVKEDPNIRSFWGTSLDSMWQRTFESDGGLGGAIWGMVDETFMLPDTLPGFNDWWGIIDDYVIPAEYSGNTVGYGEWGIMDTWRRKKPEFWNTKKAYSPFKLLETTIKSYTPGSAITVPVYNRFDHTGFEELTIKYSYLGEEKTLTSPAIEPHTKGVLTIPIVNWDISEPVGLKIYTPDGNLVDAYLLRRSPEGKAMKPSGSSGKISMEETGKEIWVRCENSITIRIDKSDGLIKEVLNGEGSYGITGPYLNLRTRGESVIYSFHQIKDYNKNWLLKDLSWSLDNNRIIISVEGSYSTGVNAEFKMDIYPDASIVIDYWTEGVPREYIREMGLMFEVEDIIDSLSWKRIPYWSYYPPDHLCPAEGKVSLYTEVQKSYRKNPGKEWINDTKSFYYNGTENEQIATQLTLTAKATRENILEYNLLGEGKPLVSVAGGGGESCRIGKKDEIIRLFISNEMDYVDLSWGNYQRNIILNREYSDRIGLKLGGKP